MTTTDLLARVRATRDQKGRMYDSELQTLLADVAAHLEGDAAPELLAALKMADLLLSMNDAPMGSGRRQVEAAIAKAAGRPPTCGW